MLAQVAQTTTDVPYLMSGVLVSLMSAVLGGAIALAGQFLLQKAGVWHGFSSQLWQTRVNAYQELVAFAHEALSTAPYLVTDKQHVHAKACLAYSNAISRVGVIASQEVSEAMSNYLQELLKCTALLNNAGALPQQVADGLVPAFMRLSDVVRDDLGISPLTKETKKLFATLPTEVTKDIGQR